MPVTRLEEDRVAKFLAAFNAIEQFLRKNTDGDTHSGSGLMAWAKAYRRKHGWFETDELAAIADLRNVLVHKPVTPGGYFSVPTDEVVARIGAIRDRLTQPERVEKTFLREVVTVSKTDTLADVLGLVWRRSYSQFPVLEARRVTGLLTENGITRYLARYATETLSLIELAETTVEQVVQQEEARVNFLIVARAALRDQVRFEFAGRPHLEAVLITQNGIAGESLLGIVTRWDIS